MRALLLLLALNTGHACNLVEEAEPLRLAAMRLLPNNEAVIIKKIPVLIKPQDNNLKGTYWFNRRVIELDPSICLYDKLLRESLIAHEWGHAMTHLLYDNLRAGTYHEAMADQAARRIVKDVTATLTMLENGCLKEEWYCQKLTAWSVGISK